MYAGTKEISVDINGKMKTFTKEEEFYLLGHNAV
jgi:hypothetical protein